MSMTLSAFTQEKKPMSFAPVSPGAGHNRRLIHDRRLFQLLMAVTFPFFLIAALLAALWPRWARGDAALASRRWSVLQQARAACNSAIPFVFMG